MGKIRVNPVDAKTNIQRYLNSSLSDDVLKNSNANYRSACQNLEDNNKSTVWQQMPINYFYNLLAYKNLFFKRFVDFSEKDERQLEFYKKTYFDGKSEKEGILVRKIIQDFSKIAYISCWYHSDNLTDIVFKEYAKGSVGVAVGTDVASLVDVFTSAVSDTIDEFFFGDIIYLGDEVCEKEVLTDPSDLITPLFVKSQNHNDDKEFRIVYVKNSKCEANGSFSSVTINEGTVEEGYVEIRKLESFIKKVAVKRDDGYTLKLTKYLLRALLPMVEIEEDTKSVDGFTILKII